LLDGAYLGSSFELGQISERQVLGQPTGLLKSIALFVAFDSPLGPTYLGYGRSASGQGNVYFFLGRPVGL
jgi:NTE family protein